MRKYYLDNIRWSVVVLVVVYHVFYMYNGIGLAGVAGPLTQNKAQYWDLYMYIVYPWFMSLLFIVSGMCSKYYLEKHTEREFLRSRTDRLLVPSTIGLFAFQFIQGYVNMALGGAFDAMPAMPKVFLWLIMSVSGTGALWYIQLLWVFSAVLLIFRKILKGRAAESGKRMNITGLILMTPLVWAAAQVLNTPVVVVYRFGLYGLMFGLGYCVFSHDEVTEVLKKWFLPVLLAACGLSAAFCFTYFGKNFADAPVNRSVLYAAYDWFACLAVLGGAAKYCDRENSFTRWMGRHSFGLYVFHYLGISAVGLFLAKSGRYPALFIYVLSLLAGFGTGYGLYAVISRIPFFRWAVLGIRKKEKHV